MKERRIERLQETIKARVAEIVAHELADPRRGLITITRVKLDREISSCKVYWSVIGDEKTQRLNERMLQHAAKFVQHEIAAILHTRTVPKVSFVFDQSVEGAVRMQALLNDLKREREAREAERQPPEPVDGDAPGDAVPPAADERDPEDRP